MSSIIKSPFINYASNNKKLIKVINETENTVNKPSSIIKSDTSNIEKIVREERHKAEVVSNDIINKAMNESECIIQDAKNKALELEREAYNNAFENGYNDGLKKSQEELLIKEQELQLIMEDAIKHKENIISELEPKVAIIINSLVEKLTNYVVDKEQIILYLIKKGLSEVELLENVIIRVCVDDYDYVVENKEMFTSNISEQVSIEILKDASLSSNDCIIESKSGNIDCSLNTQLNGLNSDLKLITDSMDFEGK